jgi:RecA/RadA recombinase
MNTKNAIPTRDASAIPVEISMDAMVKRAGANVARPRIVFEDTVYDGTLANAKDPFAAIDGVKEAVMSEFETVERVWAAEGYTPAEIKVALAAVLNRSDSGVPQPISNDPTVTPTTQIVDVGYDWVSGKMNTLIVPANEMSMPGFRKMPGQKWRPSMRVITRGGVPHLVANVLRCDQDAVEGIFGYIRDWVNRNSIYAGQVVNENFEFLNLTTFKPENVALTAAISKRMDHFVLGPLRWTEALDARGLPRKTGLFLYGPPGGGKTMVKTAALYLAARLGAVVVEIDPSTGMEGFEAANLRSMKLLENGYKVVLAMEDMEKLATKDRAKILDLLDGTSSKGHRRITIGTTNFIETIDRAMLRPGRFDAVEYCGLPDLVAFTHLVKVLIAEEDRGDINWEEAFPHFDGYSYAFIANAVQTIMRAAIGSAKGDLDNLAVSTEDLIDAAESVRGHFNLMQEEVVTEDESLDGRFKSLIDRSVLQQLEEYEVLNADPVDYSYISEKIREITDEVVEGRLDNATFQKSNGDTLGVLKTN